MKKLIAIAMVSLASVGCSTIHFDKSAPVAATPTQTQWHHNFAFALYEGSQPVDVKSACGQQSWTSVTTELTFLNGLASAPANLFVPAWYPKTVSITCN